MKTLERIKWRIYLIGFLICLSLFSYEVASAKSTYVVQPNDSLSSISLKLYGDKVPWKKLLEWNPQITNPNLIYPGQILSISPSPRIYNKPIPIILHSTEEVYDKLIKHIFHVNNVEYTPREEVKARIRQDKEFLNKHSTKNIYMQRFHVTRLQRELRRLEYFHILDGIFEACKQDKDYRMTALLVALAWQESHFNNVKGKQGEVTPFQFLPNTIRGLLNINKPSLPEFTFSLQNNIKEASRLAYKWLKENGAKDGNYMRALKWYNINPKYPHQVMVKYNKIMSIIKS